MLYTLPKRNRSIIQSNKFKPWTRIGYKIWISSYIVLSWVGYNHPTTTVVNMGRIMIII